MTSLNSELELRKHVDPRLLQAIVGCLQHTTTHYQKLFSPDFFSTSLTSLALHWIITTSQYHGNFSIFPLEYRASQLFYTPWSLQTCSQTLGLFPLAANLSNSLVGIWMQQDWLCNFQNWLKIGHKAFTWIILSSSFYF